MKAGRWAGTGGFLAAATVTFALAAAGTWLASRVNEPARGGRAVAERTPPAGIGEPAPGRRLPVLDGEGLRHWQRFAVNGLLEPLLDGEDPLRWAAPHLVTPCAESATVTADGVAPVPGEPVPLGRFVLRWRLADCLPFGVASIGLRGEVEMTLERHADRIEARVVPHRLVVSAADGRVATTSAPFDATLRLTAPGAAEGVAEARPEAAAARRDRLPVVGALDRPEPPAGS